MAVFAKEDDTKNTVEFLIFSVTIIAFIVIGFGIIGNQGLFTDTQLLVFYILLAFYNVIFILFSGIVIFVKRVQDFLIVYLHNFENSWLQNNGLFRVEKGTLLYTVFDNFVLLFLATIILFSPVFFLGFLVPRQTALQILPVVPQATIPLKEIGFRTFYNVFPAFSGETGMLTILNSVVASIIILLSVAIFGKSKAARPIGYWIALFVVGFVVSGFAWNFVHATVAAGQEFSAISHFIFGVEQGVLMVLTGSVAPALALHFLNLLFWVIIDEVGSIDLFRTAGFPILVGIIFVSIIAFIIFSRRKKKKKR